MLFTHVRLTPATREFPNRVPDLAILELSMDVPELQLECAIAHDNEMAALGRGAPGPGLDVTVDLEASDRRLVGLIGLRSRAALSRELRMPGITPPRRTLAAKDFGRLLVESGHDGWTALSDERSRFRDCIAHPWVSDVGSDVKGVRITVIRRTRLKGDVGMPVQSQVRSGWRRSCFRLTVGALMALIVIIGSGLGWIAYHAAGPTRRRRRDHTGWRRGLLRRSGSPPFFGRRGEPVARVVGDRVAPRMGHEASGRRVLADGRAGRAWGS